jgi:hypothetical protein
MRTSTFSILLTAIGIAALFALYGLAANFEIWLPRTGVDIFDVVIDLAQSKFFEIAAVVLVLPLYIFILYPLNKRLRVWRKARGRDIEAEERYETESGILTLTEKTHRNELESENHLLNRGVQWYRRRSGN